VLVGIPSRTVELKTLNCFGFAPNGFVCPGTVFEILPATFLGRKSDVLRNIYFLTNAIKKE
jgi:hypothetical protein